MSSRSKSIASKGKEVWYGKVRNLFILVAIVASILGWIFYPRNDTRGSNEGHDRGASATAVVARQQEESARVRTIAAQQSIEGTWRVVDGAGTPVYVGDYTIDSSGNLTKFRLEFSFVGSNNIAYSNTWNCSSVVQSADRYDCTYTQRWDGGSIKEPASLTRTNSSTFSGRYMHNNLWKEITFQKQG